MHEDLGRLRFCDVFAWPPAAICTYKSLGSPFVADYTHAHACTVRTTEMAKFFCARHLLMALAFFLVGKSDPRSDNKGASLLWILLSSIGI